MEIQCEIHAMRAASQLPVKEPTDVDGAPASACLSK